MNAILLIIVHIIIRRGKEMTTPVNKVNGIGPKTVEYLKAKKITTVEGLVKRGASVLEAAPGFSVGRAENTINAANALLSGSPVQKTAKPVSTVKGKSEKKVKKEKKDKKKDKKGKKEKKKDKKSKNKKGKNKNKK